MGRCIGSSGPDPRKGSRAILWPVPEPEPREVRAEEAAATAAISTADPMVAAFVRRAGPFALRPGDPDPFTSLSRAIVFQQLAGRAAAAIHGRFVAAIGGAVT